MRIPWGEPVLDAFLAKQLESADNTLKYYRDNIGLDRMGEENEVWQVSSPRSVEEQAEIKMSLLKIMQGSYHKEKADYCVMMAQEQLAIGEKKLHMYQEPDLSRLSTQHVRDARGERENQGHREFAANWLRMAAACKGIPLDGSPAMPPTPSQPAKPQGFIQRGIQRL